MPVFYNYTENGVAYSFDDVFVPADAFRQGNLWSWGSNSYGRLGDNTQVNRSTPVTTLSGGANWKQVSCGRSHAVAIKTDGTLWCWGRNDFGQLGEVGTFLKLSPVTTFAGGTNWKQVGCGYNHTAAIKTDGTLWVWGRNISGQLGDNTTTQRNTPVTTFAGGTNWKQVAGGYGHTAAIKTDGTLWTWGSNGSGQLGDNTTTQRNTPVTTFTGGNNWKQVACGQDLSFQSTAAIKTDGTLWTWGNNANGGLGDNTTTQRNTPVTTFAGGTNWKQVSSGGSATSAIKTDGTLWVWGRNYNGQLGINNTSQRNTPVTTFLGGTNWKQVSTTNVSNAAIKTDGTLWNCGWNNQGQLGDNTGTQRLIPVTTFLGGTNWKQVFSSTNSTTAITYIDDYI